MMSKLANTTTTLFLTAATVVPAFFASLPAQAKAASYPAKPITLVISTPPGSGSDIVGRKIADGLAKGLGQPVIVENVGGAAGLVAAEMVARKAPDGHTLVWNAPAAITTWPYLKKLSFNPEKDLKPVSLAVRYPLVWLANPSLQIHGIADLVKLDQEYTKKGKSLTAGNAGVGGQNQLGILMLNQQAGTHLLPVPYKGEGPSLLDLAGGHIDTVVTSLTSALPYLQNKRVIAIACASKERASALPDLRTVAEQGYPDYSIEGWGGIFAPAKTPDDIVKILNAAIVKVVRTPAMAKIMRDEGSEPVGSTPGEFAAVIQQGSHQNKDLIKQFKLAEDH